MAQKPDNPNRLVPMILTLMVAVIGISFLIMPLAEGEDDAVFKGYVTEKGSGSALENVYVNLHDGQQGNDTTTDATGYFEMNITAGDYHLHVKKDGYQNHDNDLGISGNETMWYNLTLAHENAIIKGYVTEEDSQGAIENASVSIWDNENGNATSTDFSGYYEMNTADGHYDFWAGLDGYSTFFKEIDIHENETRWINVTLKPMNSMIKGYVWGEESRGSLEGAMVGIWGEFGNQTSTNQDGYYEMNASPGEYHFYVIMDGYSEYHEEMQIWDHEEIWKNVTLVQETAMIKGYIMDSSRALLVDAEVEFDNHADGMHYTVGTDDTGYFERSLIGGEWYVEVNKWQYYTNRDEISLSDFEELWYNVTLDPAVMVRVSGFVTENGTGNPIAHEWLELWADRYDENAWTTDNGSYELWVAADQWYEIDMDVGGFMRYEDEMYISKDTCYDIILDTVPPPDVTVKGYVSGYETRGPIEAMVGAMNFRHDTNTGTMSDEETGYFEFDAWSGLGGIMSMAENYYMFFMVMNFTGNEFWYNITLYPELDAQSTIFGWVEEANGDPAQGAEVLLVNYMTGVPLGDEDDGNQFPYMTMTDQDGYYEMEVPDGEWYLIVSHDDESGIVQEVTVVEEAVVNVTLPDLSIENAMSVEFTDWNNISFINRGPFGMDSSTYLVRIQIDFMMGNRDGTVDESEADFFEEFMDALSEEDDPDFDEDNTNDEFSVDGIIYDFLLDEIIYGISNIPGPITSTEPVRMEMIGELVSQTPIPEADEHEILVNTSYQEEDEDSPESLTIILPDGFILEAFEATENVSVEGRRTDTIAISFIGEPVEDAWEWVTLTAMPVNILPTVDAGEDQVDFVGEKMEFDANATDIDGTIELYEWDFDSDGIWDHTSQSSTANFTYNSTGNHTVKVRVTDDRGGMKEDTLVVIVKPLVVLLPNLQIDSLELSVVEPGDGDEVEIIVTLKNTGNAPAKNIKVRIYIDGDLKDLLNVGDIGPNASVTISYNWTAREGKHTIRINMTYSGGGDETEHTITVEGEESSFIPGFELLFTVAAVMAGTVLTSRKKRRK